MSKIQVYAFTFLCYTSIHTLRTSYSCAKKNIADNINVNEQFMGIVDALMLGFLGIGHFAHTLKPIKKPVKTLYIAMILCGINYALIPLCMSLSVTRNLAMISILMCLNGYLQSFTWPNLLMIIHEKYLPQNNPVLLGFWSTNSNIGNIIGYILVLIIVPINQQGWIYQLIVAAMFSITCGGIIFMRINEVIIAGNKDVKQKSFMQYDPKNIFPITSNRKISSTKSLQDNLIEFQENSVRSEKSFKYTKSLSSYQSSPVLRRGLSTKSLKSIQQIQGKLNRNEIKQIKVVKQPEKVAQTPLSITEVFKDPNVVLLTITFSLSKSVIYGIMLWLPLYFQQSKQLNKYNSQIPITYDAAAIFGSILIGYLFKKINNKGLLMIPFMIVLFVCFFILKFAQIQVTGYFIIIGVVGFTLGGIFNTLSGLVVMELTKVIPENLKTSSLGFYSALTMAVGNLTTALTQILIGFIIGKNNKQGIFVVFMVYCAICLICLILVAIITIKQQGVMSIGEVLVIQEVEKDKDENTQNEENEEKNNNKVKQLKNGSHNQFQLNQKKYTQKETSSLKN